jgi:aspartyl protease family protein
MTSPKRTGAVMYILAGVALLWLMTILFDDAIERMRNPNTSPESFVSNDGHQTVVLQRNRAGHYVLDGQVNGVPVKFLLDTGATLVAVPASLASRLGLDRGMRMTVVTATGPTTAYSTIIDSVRIGELEETQVVASILADLPRDEILLGMSFLKRLDFTQRGDTLILTQRTTP